MALTSVVMVSFQTLFWKILFRKRFVVTLGHCFYNLSEDKFAGPKDILVQLGISFIFLDFQLQSEMKYFEEIKLTLITLERIRKL